MNGNHNNGLNLNSLFRQYSERIFLVSSQDERILTYGQTLRYALRISEELRRNGVGSGDSIATILPNSIDFAVLYFAAMISGIVVVPIDPFRGSEEQNEILTAVNPKLVIVHDSEAASKSAFSAVTLHQMTSGTDVHEDVSLSFTADATCLITFTSGSTGKPKGVRHSIASLFSSAYAFASQMKFDERNRFYHCLPMSYMAGILNLLLVPFVSGGTVVVGNRFTVAMLQDFWTTPIRYEVNTLWLIPTIMSTVLRMDRGHDGEEYGKKKKLVVCAGTAPVPVALKNEFSERYSINVFESYGLSESLFVAMERPGLEQRVGSVGKVLPGVRIKIASDGELMVQCDWMFQGYVGDSGRANVSRWLMTGDLGRVDEEGYVYITGRKKDLIIRGGVNVSPQRIEQCIDRLGVFTEYAVIGVQDEVLGEKTVCCYVAPHTVTPDTLQGLNAKLQNDLGRDYVIDSFVILSEIPKNINGKIDKIALRANVGGEKRL